MLQQQKKQKASLYLIKNKPKVHIIILCILSVKQKININYVDRWVTQKGTEINETLFKPKWYLLDEMFIYTIQLNITLDKGLTEIIFSLTKYMY